jgi:positive regulator of sigma E activity
MVFLFGVVCGVVFSLYIAKRIKKKQHKTREYNKIRMRVQKMHDNTMAAKK